jgi:prophage endopeptidase
MSIITKAIAAHWRVIVGALLLLLIVITAKIARSNYDRAITAESSLESSAMVTSNVITAMNLIHDISKAAYEDKQSLAEKGAAHEVYIRQALEGDACAHQLVPDSATGSLQQLKDSLRTSTSSTDKR